MASVVWRGKKGEGKWYVRWRTARGVWKREVCDAKTKTEAKRLADELQMKADRQGHGLEPMPAADGGGTLDKLLEWWLKTYSAGTASHERNECSVRLHLIGSELGALRLADVTPGKVEVFLQEKSSTLGPQSINHLRRFLMTAFNRAKRADKWAGANPAADVQRRKVPRRSPDYLRAHEVPALLAAIAPEWRALYATAIYTGLRKGELLGLRKYDVDLKARLLTVAVSYDRETTKGGHADVIPIAEECVPFLKYAIKVSTSELVFPRPDGTMYRGDIKLEVKLRRAMGRAGLTLGFKHVCRKKGCTYVEDAADAELRRCLTHGAKLWPKAKVRKIRFHDLRHTTASLLMMAGANPAAVQRILRHSDPRITTEIYGHLAPDYLRAEIDRLNFGVTDEQHAPTKDSLGLVPLVSQDSENGTDAREIQSKSAVESATSAVRAAGVEPATFGFGDQRSIQLS
jgi:integrase